MTIQEQLLYTTLRVERLDTHGNILTIGTGFILSRPVDETQLKLYLVSNKHIILGADAIAFTFSNGNNGQPIPGKSTRITISEIKDKIIGHLNPDIDIAVLEFTNLFNLYSGKFFFKCIHYDMLSTFDEPELSVAENVLFIGYPENRYDVVNNLPLIRQGLIASNPKNDYNGNPVFIIDAQVFPGSSGSPVIIDLTYENMRNGQIILGGDRKIKVLGIVAETMIRNNQLQAVQTGVRVTVQEVLGLGVVFKSTAIKELIDSMPL